MKMKVDPISNIEYEKMSFVSDDKNTFSFGKWLAINILLQTIWGQIKQESDSKFGSQSSSLSSELNIQIGTHHKVLAYVAEEAYWTISAQIDEISEEIINNKVLSKIIKSKKKKNKQTTITDYIIFLHETIQYY